MLHFLTKVCHSAIVFLKQFLPEDSWLKITKVFKNPKEIMDREFARRNSWNCLQHGDSWHNNFLFRKMGKQMKVQIVDWQVIFFHIILHFS